MFNKLINYFKTDEYSLLIGKNKIYINNYEKIIDVNDKSIILKFSDKVYLIDGTDLVIKKLDKYEMYITGMIRKISVDE